MPGAGHRTCRSGSSDRACSARSSPRRSGLPYAFASHFAPGADDAGDRRSTASTFQPSGVARSALRDARFQRLRHRRRHRRRRRAAASPRYEQACSDACAAVSSGRCRAPLPGRRELRGPPRAASSARGIAQALACSGDRRGRRAVQPRNPDFVAQDRRRRADHRRADIRPREAPSVVRDRRQIAARRMKFAAGARDSTAARRRQDARPSRWHPRCANVRFAFESGGRLLPYQDCQMAPISLGCTHRNEGGSRRE